MIRGEGIRIFRVNTLVDSPSVLLLYKGTYDKIKILLCEFDCIQVISKIFGMV